MKIVVSILMLVLLSGCGLQNFSNSVKATSYFREKDYQTGVAVFSEEVKESPENSSAYYYLGRFHLAQNNPASAFDSLKRAVEIEPNDSDYQFWLGVAAGASGEEAEEWKRYEAVLELTPSHDKAKLYLAHLKLKDGRYEEALMSYDEILVLYPFHAAALYNRAICMKLLKQKDKEEEAWLKYLKHYPSGFLSAQAADHLNNLGDFSYRNHSFGYRTVTLKEITFKDGSGPLQFDARQSMRLVGAILSNLARGNIQLTVFCEGNSDLARIRAYNLKKFLLDEYPDLENSQIEVSWFGEAEILFGDK